MALSEEGVEILRRAVRGVSSRRHAGPSRPQLPARVFLVGFMGSGKTTVGRLLADRLNWRFVDLDARIEERSGTPVRKIFALHGEGRFRRIEHDALRDATRDGGKSIVALGGGAFVSEVNRALVRRSGVAVWLDVPYRTVARRVAGDRTRPMATPDQLHKLYRSRLPFYHEADVRVRAGDATADRIAAEILKLLRDDWAIVAERRRLFP